MTRKQALRAARKRGLVTKAEADFAKRMVVKRRAVSAVIASEPEPASTARSPIPTDPEALRAEFRTYHGKCPRCQGADVFCELLPFLHAPFREGLVIQRLRREEHKRLKLDCSNGGERKMPEEVKQQLRQRAAEKAKLGGRRVRVEGGDGEAKSGPEKELT